MKINVIDGIMGVGKSSMAIDMIKADQNNSYIYITPYLDECTRVIQECSEKHFVQPDAEAMGTKSRHFKHLITKERNIASTHSLFKRMDQETRDLLSVKDYVLILDEVMDVVEVVNITPRDLQILKENFIEINEHNEITWKDKSYNGKYNEYKNLCDEGMLVLISNTVVMWKFPAEVFNYFKEVYILTYMFDSQIQKYYFDYYNIEYNYRSIDRDQNNNYMLVDRGSSTYEFKKKEQVKDLIILTKDKLNRVGEKDFSLSYSWFEKNKGTIIMQEIKNNLSNFFKHKCKTKASENGWTTIKDFRGVLENKGYKTGFIPINERATNKYQHKKSMAYVSNRFLQPYIKEMFNQKDIKIDEDLWALSEMLQWIWRGSIRKNEPMKLYIPSYRMRSIFERWLNNEI